ncbi:hypothetical protein LZ31DRAFT_249710 [Colletotrichum somersetense]|nr:hypothetical protein LZ31DRAFT_249710 [Colletotrichum somersetense]
MLVPVLHPYMFECLTDAFSRRQLKASKSVCLRTEGRCSSPSPSPHHNPTPQSHIPSPAPTSLLVSCLSYTKCVCYSDFIALDLPGFVLGLLSGFLSFAFSFTSCTIVRPAASPNPLKLPCCYAVRYHYGTIHREAAQAPSARGCPTYCPSQFPHDTQASHRPR